MCAFDVSTPQKRDELRKKLYSNGLIVIGCGPNSIRFRPPLIISTEEIEKALKIIDETLKTL
jgi:L-lysine 6-transaminase